MNTSNTRQQLRFDRQLKRAKKIGINVPFRLRKNGSETPDLNKALEKESVRAVRYIKFGGKY